jgi:hypothetical protein
MVVIHPLSFGFCDFIASVLGYNLHSFFSNNFWHLMRFQCFQFSICDFNTFDIRCILFWWFFILFLFWLRILFCALLTRFCFWQGPIHKSKLPKVYIFEFVVVNGCNFFTKCFGFFFHLMVENSMLHIIDWFVCYWIQSTNQGFLKIICLILFLING